MEGRTRTCVKRGAICGCSSMVEQQPSKLWMWIRFPLLAPFRIRGRSVSVFGIDHFFRENMDGEGVNKNKKGERLKMSEYSRPFNRVTEAVSKIAEKRGVEIKNTGNRLADSLEAIANTASGIAVNLEESTATSVAEVVADLNELIVSLKNANLVMPDEFTMTVTKNVTDSISGREDRQYNTNQIANVAESDGVITITLSKAVSELKDFNAGGNWGTHKWLGIGISAGINPITSLKYNGQSLTAEDVTEATQVGLSAGYFVRWVAADLVVGGDNSQPSKDKFTLWANGYKETEFTIKIVEP